MTSAALFFLESAAVVTHSSFLAGTSDRAKVCPSAQGQIYTFNKLWKGARTNEQNFTVCRCRPKWPARSSTTGLRHRLSAAQRNPSSSRLARAVPRALRPSTPAISVASGSGWVSIWHFFLARCGAHASRGQNKGFPPSGRMQGERWEDKRVVFTRYFAVPPELTRLSGAPRVLSELSSERSWYEQIRSDYNQIYHW